jgi:hypothetical protein
MYMVFLRAYGSTRMAESQQTRSAADAMRVAAMVYSLSSGKRKIARQLSGIRDNCHCPAWRLLIGVAYRRCLPTLLIGVAYRRCLPALITHVFVHALGRAGVRTDRTGVSERCREWMLATRCHTDARRAQARRGRMALVKVHGESYYGAHRLPVGKTAAEKESAGVGPVRQ